MGNRGSKSNILSTAKLVILSVGYALHTGGGFGLLPFYKVFVKEQRVDGSSVPRRGTVRCTLVALKEVLSRIK